MDSTLTPTSSIAGEKAEAKMAWFGITHDCGHQGDRVQIYGTNSNGERDKEAARLGRGLCPDCLRAQYAAQSGAASKVAAEKGLPALVGSPRQIAWAETLRAKKISDAELIERSATLRSDIAAMTRADGALVDRIVIDKLAAYRVETSAKFWIDNRELSAENAICRRIEKIKPQEVTHA